MKAIRFTRVGPPEVLALEDAPDPVARAGQVVVRVRAIGVNFADTRFRRGEYFVRPVFPAIPGMEAAGEIESIGDGVTGVTVGDRVMALGAGAYAERMVARASALYRIPAGLDFATAAALPVQSLTAHHCLDLVGRLVRGERVLVHAAAGGVGSLAVQLARLMGASFVVGTASTDAKRALVRQLGADLALDARESDFATSVRDATAGRGIDVMLEMIGGTDHYKRNLGCLAPFGRMVVYGAAGGDTRGNVEPIALMPKNLTVVGYYLTPILEQPELCVPALAEVAAHVAARRIRIPIEKLPLADAAQAHRRMEARETVGKLVLETPP